MSRVVKQGCGKCGYVQDGEWDSDRCPNCDGQGMSQERTERRDWAKDREIIAAATPGPWVAVAGPMDRHWNHQIQTAWEHPQLKGPDVIVSLAMRVDCQYIYIKPTDAFLIAESRMAWPAALDEIDRLNATIAKLREEGKNKDTALEVVQTRFGRYVDHSRDYESRLNGRIDEEVAAVKVLTAQVQERAKEVVELKQEIERWRFCYQDTPERLAAKDTQIREVGQLAKERREEIERLRAEVDFARIEFNGIGLQAYVAGADKINRRATEAGERMFAALKGAE